MTGEIDPDVFVRIQSDLLIVGDRIMTDRHHASGGNYEDTDPQNQIGGIIPVFSLLGGPRHGMESVAQQRGITACHPGESNGNFRKDDLYSGDLDVGYHPKGDCLNDETDTGCVIHDLFSGARNFGGGIVDCTLINPLYDDTELRRVFDRGKGHTTAMDDKDKLWHDEYLCEFTTDLADRIEAGP